MKKNFGLNFWKRKRKIIPIYNFAYPQKVVLVKKR